MVKELDILSTRDVEEQVVEIHYSLCLNQILDKEEKMIIISLTHNDSTPEIFFYPHKAGEAIDTTSVISAPEELIQDNCSLCQKSRPEETKAFRINASTIEAHESCIEHLHNELIRFCRNTPELVADNL